MALSRRCLQARGPAPLPRGSCRAATSTAPRAARTRRCAAPRTAPPRAGTPSRSASASSCGQRRAGGRGLCVCVIRGLGAGSTAREAGREPAGRRREGAVKPLPLFEATLRSRELIRELLALPRRAPRVLCVECVNGGKHALEAARVGAAAKRARRWCAAPHPPRRCCCCCGAAGPLRSCAAVAGRCCCCSVREHAIVWKEGPGAPKD